MVCDADEIPGLYIPEPGFLLYLPQSSSADILSKLLMTLGQVPEAVSAYEQAVRTAILHEPSGSIDLAETRTNGVIGFLGFVSADINLGQSSRFAEFFRQHPGILWDDGVENHGVGIGECLVFRMAYQQAPVLEINLVHRIRPKNCYICRLTANL